MDNKYTLELTDYIIDNHPYMITDKDFIQTRGNMAMDESINQYKAGCNVEDSDFFARKILYKGLIFSPYNKIKELLDNCFSGVVKEENVNETALKLYDKYKYVFEEYNITDEFEGSNKCCELEDKLIKLIEKDKIENGLQ